MKKFRLTNVILICALALNGCVLTAPSPGDLAQTYNLGKDVTKPITRTEVEEVRAHYEKTKILPNCVILSDAWKSRFYWAIKKSGKRPTTKQS